MHTGCGIDRAEPHRPSDNAVHCFVRRVLIQLDLTAGKVIR